MFKCYNMKFIKNSEEYYNYWLKKLDYTNCIFIDNIGYGDGQNY